MKRKKLIKFRIDLGLNSKEMAERLKLKAPTYSRLENGKKKETIDLVYSLSNEFGISKEKALDILELPQSTNIQN